MLRPSLSRSTFSVLVLLVFLTVAVLPLAVLFYDSIRIDDGFSFSAYRGVLTEARQWGLLYNSLLISLGAAFFATVLGVIVAFCLEFLRVPGRKLLVYGLALPFLIPPYVSAVAWLDVLGKNGLLNSVLREKLGLALLLPDINTMWGVVFVSGLSYFPIVCLMTALELRRFDRRLIEAAKLSGGWLRTLCGVVFPLLIPSVVAGGLIVFLLVLVGFSVPSLLQVNVYPVEIFTTFSAFYDFQMATAQALPLVACGGLVLAGGGIYLRTRKAWLTGASRSRQNDFGGKGLRLLGSVLCWSLVLVSAVAPLGVLIWRSLPVRTYWEVFATAKEEILASVLTAGVSATVITLLAFSIGYLRRMKSRVAYCHWVGFVPFLISGPVLGVALIYTWNRAGVFGMVYDSVAVVVLGCAARFLFFAQCGFNSALDDLHAGIDEPSIAGGYSWWRHMFGVLLPLSWPVLVGVWGLSFILCLGELDVSVLVCPPGFTTLPVRTFSLMHYGPGRMVAALSVLTTAMIIICAGATALIYSRGKKALNARNRV